MTASTNPAATPATAVRLMADHPMLSNAPSLSFHRVPLAVELIRPAAALWVLPPLSNRAMARCHTNRESKATGQCSVATARVPVVTNAVNLTVGREGHASIEEGTRPRDNKVSPALGGRSAGGQQAHSTRPSRRPRRR